MIPRICHMWWTGARPSWLRLQTVESFRRHHPMWEVRLVQGPESDAPAQDSDLFRWQTLYDVGGVWADLDIVFYRNISPLIRGEGELYLSTDGNADQSYAIGLMAARPRSPIVALILHAAKLERGKDPYQACGTDTLNRILGPTAPRGVQCIPSRCLYPVPATSTMMMRLWERDHPPMPSHALHWYGGHPLSRALEHTSPEELSHAPHAIGEALRWSETGERDE